MGEARRVSGKPPIAVRWVDVNKGDDRNPNVMSRVVGRLGRLAKRPYACRRHRSMLSGASCRLPRPRKASACPRPCVREEDASVCR